MAARTASHAARDWRRLEAEAKVVALEGRLVTVHHELTSGRGWAHDDGAAAHAAEHALGTRVNHSRVRVDTIKVGER